MSEHDTPALDYSQPGDHPDDADLHAERAVIAGVHPSRRDPVADDAERARAWLAQPFGGMPMDLASALGCLFLAQHAYEIAQADLSEAARAYYAADGCSDAVEANALERLRAVTTSDTAAKAALKGDAAVQLQRTTVGLLGGHKADAERWVSVARRRHVALALAVQAMTERPTLADEIAVIMGGDSRPDTRAAGPSGVWS